MELFLLLGLLIVLNLAARRWGVSSVDGLDSAEWERRRQWSAYQR